jgi:hypothetical protein
VEAVAYHTTPWEVRQTEFDVLAATYVANILAQQVMAERCNQPFISKMNMDYLTKLGVKQFLPQWEAMARTQAQKIINEAAAKGVVS